MVGHPADGGRGPIEIVLADDHTMVRRGLRMVLDAEDGLVVVAEAGDVDEALRHTRERRPAVVVLDLNMPGTATLPAIGRFLEAAPGSAVVVLTMEGDPGMAIASTASPVRAGWGSSIGRPTSHSIDPWRSSWSLRRLRQTLSSVLDSSANAGSPRRLTIRMWSRSSTPVRRAVGCT